MNTLYKIVDSLVAPSQEKYWEGVQWLTYEGIRGSGKTHLLALSFIKEALRSPVPVHIWDHFRPHARNTRSMYVMAAEIERCVTSINDMTPPAVHLDLHINSYNWTIAIIIK